MQCVNAGPSSSAVFDDDDEIIEEVEEQPAAQPMAGFTAKRKHMSPQQPPEKRLKVVPDAADGCTIVE